MATLQPGTVHDVPGVYRVCRLTAAAGADASDRHADPDLLGHVWAAPYLAAPGAVALVVRDEQGVAGYCVGVPDTVAFEEWLEAAWLPPLRARYPRGSGSTPADAGLVARLHDWPRTDPSLVARYPAHLHVDLLPRLQGQGWGRRVVDGVLTGLAHGGAGGAHLGVDPANPGAAAFYLRLGFAELTDGGGGATRWFGIDLHTPTVR